MSNLFNLRNDLFHLFKRTKDCNAGYSMENNNKIIVDVEGERFLITIDKIENPAKEMQEDVKKIL